MASLTITQLRKRDNFAKLLVKIQNLVPLTLISAKKQDFSKESMIVSPEPSLVAALELLANDTDLDPNVVIPEKYLPKKNVLMLPTTENGLIFSGYFQKTPDFGGQSQEQVYQQEGKEHFNLNSFLRKSTIFGLMPITLVIETSNNQIFTFEDIFKVKPADKINGNHGKADFEFIDKQGNVKFSISHKTGSRAVHFRQWSGVKEFEGHPEIKTFKEDLQKWLKDNYGDIHVFPPTLCVGRAIQDIGLKKQAVFGKNVDFLVQGKCEFLRYGEPFTYILKANLILEKNESMDLLPPEYQPAILARRGDLQRNSFEIKGCRGTIYPISGRRIQKHI